MGGNTSMKPTQKQINLAYALSEWAHDGQKYGEGKTLLEAIEAAMEVESD